jgi:type I restriction enzyme R subunit
MKKPLSESQTRQEIIDQQLARAGWGVSSRSMVAEFLVRVSERDEDYAHQRGFADYALLGRDGRPIAIVEAKHSSRDAIEGKRQAAEYSDELKKQFGYDPFVFLANGRQILFWDRDNYPPREVSGFLSIDDLERLSHQRRYAQPLHSVEINSTIVDRDYQAEAVRRVTEAMELARRKFLLVMATGTGKTRTTIALIDLLLRAKRVQRVLFLADRRELVRQAMSAFKHHVPNESLARIEGGESTGARIQFATYPSMMQVFSRLSTGYYDLIIADESHRTIYRRYGSRQCCRVE